MFVIYKGGFSPGAEGLSLSRPIFNRIMGGGGGCDDPDMRDDSDLCDDSNFVGNRQTERNKYAQQLSQSNVIVGVQFFCLRRLFAVGA